MTPSSNTGELGTRSNTESTWLLTWTLFWGSCSEPAAYETERIHLHRNHTSGHVYFTTKNGSQAPDLVAATADGVCSKSEGYTYNVTGTLDVPAGKEWDGLASCAVVSPSSPTAKPCGAKVNSAAASSISAAMTSSACGRLDPPINCPAKDDESIAQRLAVTGVACLATIVGGLGFLLI